jgi:hypothetical protein
MILLNLLPIYIGGLYEPVGILLKPSEHGIQRLFRSTVAIQFVKGKFSEWVQL